MAGALEKPLQLPSSVKSLVGLGDTFFRLPFVIAQRLAIHIFFGTAFADERVRVDEVQAQKLEFVKGGSVSGARAFPNEVPADTRSTKNRNTRKGGSSMPSDGADFFSLRLSKFIQKLAMTQKTTRVCWDAIGFSYLDPRPAIGTLQGIRMTNGIAKADPRKESDVIVASFMRIDRTLPKNIVIGYAKRNFLAIATAFPATG